MRPVLPTFEEAFSRRRFLALTSFALASGLLASSKSVLGAPPPQEDPAQTTGVFEVVPLPYAYDALEPWIDGETMRLHHDKHYAAYTRKLNEALADFPAYRDKTIEEILGSLSSLPEAVRKGVRDNGGGYYNHGLFWRMMGPGASRPEGKLADAIEKAFGGLDRFKKLFSQEAASVFGSGWTWLVRKRDGSLEIGSTPNQDSPIMVDIAKVVGTPILGLDVWEHAYYLKYKNERAKYIEAWWNVVNWKAIEQRFDESAFQH